MNADIQNDAYLLCRDEAALALVRHQQDGIAAVDWLIQQQGVQDEVPLIMWVLLILLVVSSCSPLGAVAADCRLAPTAMSRG